MAATTHTAGKRNYVEFDEYIDFQLQKTRTGIKATDILTALAGVATLFLGYLLVFVAFDHWVVPGGFGTVGRWLMLGALMAACIAWVVWKVVIPSRKNVTGLYAAKAIENTEPGLQDTLLNLVDLRAAGKDVSEDIRRAMEKRAAVTLSKGNVDAAVDRRPLMRLSLSLLALVVICCLYSLFSPKKISASVWRALFPASNTPVDTSYKIDKVAIRVEQLRIDPQTGRAKPVSEDLPADASVAAGSKPQVVVDLSYNGEPPQQVTLYYSTQDEKYRDVPVPMKRDPNEPKRYLVRLDGETNRGLLQNTTYRIEAGDAKAGPFEITVVRPPVASVRTVKYVYPKYMEREPLTQEGGHIDAWEGTQVTVNAVTDRPVREAWLVFTDGEDVNKPVHQRQMQIADGTQLALTLKQLEFRVDGSYPHFYHIRAVGKDGLRDPSPALYGVTIRRDLPPEIKLLDPQGNDRDVPANTETLPLLFEARDPDFKLTKVTLRAELTRANQPQAEPQEHAVRLFQGSRKSLRAARDWDLRPLTLQVGDRVKFRLEARDNKPPAGNRGFSRWVTLRIVEPASKDELERQKQEDRQRQDQIRKQQQNDDPGNERARQPQDNADGGKGGDEPKKTQNNQQGDGNPETQNGKGGAKKPKGGMGDPQAGKGNQKQGDPQPQNGGGQGERRDPDGQRQPGQNEAPPKDDQEVLNKLLRDNPPNGQPKENGRPKENPQPQDNGQPNNGQPNNGQPNEQPKANETPGQQPKNGAEPKQPQQKQGNQPDNGMGGMEKTPMGGDPNAPKNAGNKPDDGKPKTNQKTPPKGGNPSPQKNGMGGMGSGKTQPRDNAAGNKKPKGNTGGKGTPKTGKPDGMNDGGTSNQPGKKDKPKNGTGKPKRNTDGADGPRQNVKDDGTPATPRKANGSETGTADPDKNSKANPTEAKDPDKVQRREGTKPVKRPGTGDPRNPDQKNGTKNPGTAKPKTTKKTGPDNAADRTTDPKKVGGEPGKTTNKRNTQGNEPIRKTDGHTTPKSKKPTGGGKPGKATPNDQGKTGSTQKGAGDNTPMPGKRQDGMGRKTGTPGNKNGMGSSTQPKNGGRNGGMTGGKAGNSTGKPNGGMGGTQPGTSGGVPNGKTSPNAQRGPAGGVGNPANAAGHGTPPSQSGEQADLDYGKKAANLNLNRKLALARRGKLSKEELRKYGWTSQQDAIEHIKGIQRRINNPNDLEMQEFLKGVRYLSKRSGRNVKTDKLEIGTTGGAEPPPFLRKYTRAFKNSVRSGR